MKNITKGSVKTNLQVFGHLTFLATTGIVVAALLFLVAGLIRSAHAEGTEGDWRIVVQEAATTSGPNVLLGEIAGPHGSYSEEVWNKLAYKELWPAPPARSKPMMIQKNKLYGALRHYLGDPADRCVLSGSLAVQLGGDVLLQEELTKLVVNTLTPKLGKQNGTPELREYRIPEYIFLSDSGNELKIEVVGELDPGRLTLRMTELDFSGNEVRKYSGSVFMDVWAQVPAAARPLNRDEALGMQDVTFVRKNLAYLRGQVWDGKGGPWRVTSPVGTSQVIYMSSLEPLPVISRGDEVTLIFEGKHIQLEVPAEALADGGYGEVITVRNKQSEREVVARVKDHGTVTVQ